MKLTADQITALADFSEGDDVIVSTPVKGRMGDEIRSRITVTRDDGTKERVFIYDNGGVERVPDGA